MLRHSYLTIGDHYVGGFEEHPKDSLFKSRYDHIAEYGIKSECEILYMRNGENIPIAEDITFVQQDESYLYIVRRGKLFTVDVDCPYLKICKLAKSKMKNNLKNPTSDRLSLLSEKLESLGFLRDRYQDYSYSLYIRDEQNDLNLFGALSLHYEGEDYYGHSSKYDSDNNFDKYYLKFSLGSNQLETHEKIQSLIVPILRKVEEFDGKIKLGVIPAILKTLEKFEKWLSN